MNPRNPIFYTTVRLCIAYQEDSKGYAADAMFWRDAGPEFHKAALRAQQKSWEYANAAQLRLNRIIGVE